MVKKSGSPFRSLDFKRGNRIEFLQSTRSASATSTATRVTEESARIAGLIAVLSCLRDKTNIVCTNHRRDGLQGVVWSDNQTVEQLTKTAGVPLDATVLDFDCEEDELLESCFNCPQTELRWNETALEE